MIKNKLNILISLTIVIMTCEFAAAKGGANISSIDVSIVALIAAPEKYHLKQVRVIGAAMFALGYSKVCLRKEDVNIMHPHNCLRINVPSNLYSYQELTDTFEDSYILLEGVFRKPVDVQPGKTILENGEVGIVTLSGPSLGLIHSVNRLENWDLRMDDMKAQFE